MMSETEKEKLREAEKVMHEAFGAVDLEMTGPDGEEVDVKSMVIGITFAVVDALFAIRDGEEWRGMADPQEIAREMLKQWGIGD
jgi:hypothetical protein